MRSRHWTLPFAFTLLVCSLVYLFVTLARQPLAISDFRYIWTAGDVWAHGGNPYGQDYPATGLRKFPSNIYPVRFWVYPFHWYLPARMAASFRPTTAFHIWVVLSVALLALAGYLAWRAAQAAGAKSSPAVWLGMIGYACSSTSLVFLLRHGQPAGLAVAGIALIGFGVATRRDYATAAGIALALLKPHLGLPMTVALLFMPRGLYAVAIGGALTLIASAPAFVTSGFWPQVTGLLGQNSGSYQKAAYNSAGGMSGMPHVVNITTGHSFSILQSVLLAAFLTSATVKWTNRVELQRHVALFLALSCSITALIVSLHSYDLTILLIPLALMPLLAKREMMVAGLGYAIFWRAENLASLLGNFRYTPTLQTLAAALILSAWMLTARSWVAATRPDGATFAHWPNEAIDPPVTNG